MLSRPARTALRAAAHHRLTTSVQPSAAFSKSAATNALSPHRAKGVRLQQTAKAATGGRREQATSAPAPQTRPSPSPAFNTEPRNDVQPLQNVRQSELDDSFIGMSGGQIFHEMMVRLGVKTIFGYSGGAILPVFDALYNSSSFDFIVPRHEQGAGHAAQGFSKVSGKPGVVVVTSGPGATNMVTPIQDAMSDGIPLVVFCGQVPTSAIGSDAFQEADVIGITRPCTKWNVMVKNVAEMPRRIQEAFEIAMSGRPGPVLVDLPKDVTASILRQAIPTSSTLPSSPSAGNNAARALSQRQIDSSIQRAADLINIAKKPIIYAGNGVLSDLAGPELLKELSAKASIPVTTTLQGLGAFDELNDLSLYMLGMHGSGAANLAMQEADLIIALGARFDDRVTGNLTKFAPQAKLAESQGRGGILHFDILPKNINKVVQATEAVEGDVVENMAKLIPQVNIVKERPDWINQVLEWKRLLPFNYEVEESPEELVKPQTVVAKLSELTAHRKQQTLITTGVGQHQMFAAQHYRWRYPRTMITSGGLGTMGFGLPAALGAKLGNPDALVIDIDGDASFNMTLTELGTAAEYNIGAKVIILNNEEQGMVVQWQSLFYEDRYAHTRQRNPDYVKFAESMHVQARRCSKVADLEESLKWLIDSDGPALLEVKTARNEPVLPMVPAGAGLSEFLVYDKEKEKERKALARKRNPQSPE